MTWHPIETAPKDGTEVLLWWRAEIGHDVVDFWASGHWKRLGDGSAGWIGESFHASEPGYWTRLICERPTHWMPLPDPPDWKRAQSGERMKEEKDDDDLSRRRRL